ncbi:Na+/H+ antiporter subunit D [PVC group bacterium]|nr:Na+/H+ antiporter subunit D [PVC group bacterium]
MSHLIVFPIIIPLISAALCLLFWRKCQIQRWIGVIGASAHFLAALLLLRNVYSQGIQVLHVGNWPAPYGITLVCDLLSGIMVVMGALIGFSVSIYSILDIDQRRETLGYYPLFHFLLMGISGAFLTGDMFNLFVWFEVMLMSSFVLLSLGGDRPQLEGAFKYVTLNLLSSAIFLAALGILYGQYGTLNMADLAYKLSLGDETGMSTVLAMMFMVAFGIKAALFPLFFWLPESYHTPPVAISAIFAGLLTKVGVYSLIRIFTLLFIRDVEFTHTVLLVFAGFTMVTGVLGAASQNGFRRILSFHIISQIGYMIMGLAIFTPLAIAGSIFYIIHHIIVKTNLFLVSGLVNRLCGSFELKKLGGLYASYPFIAILFLIPALSLAGVPPLSGFFAKLMLVKAGLANQNYFIVFIALVVSILTLFSMTKIWQEVFWKPAPANGLSPFQKKSVGLTYLFVPITLLALLTICLGIGGNAIVSLSLQTSNQLLNPDQYIHAVLGRPPL